jgi:hypothetical protein
MVLAALDTFGSSVVFPPEQYSNHFISINPAFYPMMPTSKKTWVVLAFLCSHALAYAQVQTIRDVVICPGEILTLGGTFYAQPDTVNVTLPGIGGAPDTLATYQISLSPGVSNTQACNCHPNTFFKTLGAETQQEFGTALARTPDGNLYLAGRKGSRTFIQKINAFGELIWVRDFALSPFEAVTPTELVVDSDGMLTGCGTQALFAGLSRGVVFRYNPQTAQFLWINTISSNNPTAGGILEKNAGGNFLYYQNPRFSSGETDAEILEIDRSSGVIQPGFARRYEYQASDAIAKMLLLNGRLYAAGWSEVFTDNNNTPYHRQLLSEINPDNGFVVWSELSHRADSLLADLYGRDLVADGNFLLMAGDGDDATPGNNGQKAVFLQKTNLDGQFQWIKKYAFEGTVYKLLSAADGYLIYGQSESNVRFFLKTDKNGDLLWAKTFSFGPSGSIFPVSVGPAQGLAFNGHYFFTGLSTLGNTDAFLIKMDLNGFVSDTCNAFIEQSVADFEVVDATIQPIIWAPGLSTAGGFAANSVAVPSELFETLQCPDCVPPDPCPERNDLVVSLNSTTCSNGRVNLNIRICDLDGGALPESVTLTFYAQNPFTDTTVALTDLQIFTNEADSCFSTTINDLGNELGAAYAQDGAQLFALVNFDGTVTTPVSVDDFPVTDIAECNYENNLDSYTINLPAPLVLNLGPDRLLCAGDTVVLNAGAGFNTYKWSTGANSQKIILSAGGTFRITATDACGFVQTDTIVVNFNTLPTKAITATICPGETFSIYGNTFTDNAFFYDTIPATSGLSCDTAVTIQVTKLPFVQKNTLINICPGDTIYINGIGYFESSLAFDTLQNTNGLSCDTLLRIQINELPKPFRFDSLFICEGDSIRINGQYYSQPGWVKYIAPSQFSNACDTTVNVMVVVLPKTVNHYLLEFCAGDTVFVGGQPYTLPGTVTLTRPVSGPGCDTLEVYTLQWLPGPTKAETISFCQGSSVTIQGMVYDQPGIVYGTIPTAGSGCDTAVTYTLQWIPGPTRSETIGFCPGASIVIDGVTYTQPAIFTRIAAGQNGECDTLVTVQLVFTIPQGSSNISITCPDNLNVAVSPGSGAQNVLYDLPVVSTDCSCANYELARTQGPASGGLFQVGTTKVCYTAADACGSSKSCCFNVTVREELPCDSKVSGCVRYDLLGITKDASAQYTYRIRVTNNCPNKLIYTAIQLPAGLNAVAPGNNTQYTSPDGRVYTVRNPNPTPFHSIRFKSGTDSIAGGQSDVFEFTLPQQIHPDYFLITSRLFPQVFQEALLNTFNCPVLPGATQNRSEDAAMVVRSGAVWLYPNPAQERLWVDLSAWAPEPVQARILSASGQLVQQLRLSGGEVQEMVWKERLAAGMYVLQLRAQDGSSEALRFVIE